MACFGSRITSIPGTTAVGTSTTQTVQLSFTASGTPAVVEALTEGATGLDYSILSAGNCTVGTAFQANATCSLTVTFAPHYPGRRAGAIRIKAADGSLLAATLVSGNATGALPVLVPGRIDTVAGSYGWTYTTDGVQAINAQIFTPKAALIDGNGNIILSDTGNNRIRRVDAKTGLISTIAGAGSPSFSGDGGLATQAAISGPSGLALDGAGNLYFSDYQNSVVRRIDGVSGVITTVAGTPLSPGFSGNGTAATGAQLNLPESLAFDLDGNLLIADSGNNMIRKVDAISGVISTIAGTLAGSYNGDSKPATQATLGDPTGVAVAVDGSILIADTANERIRRIAPDGTISTIAGNGVQFYGGDGGPAVQATLNGPSNVAIDPAGNVYFTDSGSNRVRMIAAQTGILQTITGSDSEAFSGDAGPADMATYYGPFGLFYAESGDIYLTDMFHMRVRRISASTLTLQYPTIRVSKTSAPKPEGLTNDGNDTLTLTAPVFSQSALDPATTTCFGTAAVSMTPAALCTLGVEFAPTAVGNLVTGTLGLPSNVPAVTPVITLTGEVLSVNPTSVAVSVLAPSTNPSMLGDKVTFQAQVTSDDTGRTGEVTFTIDGTAVCSNVTLTAAGTAACAAANLTLGSHAVIATYSGDPQNAAATSLTYTQVVKQHTTLTFVSSAPTAVVTKSVTFTLTATATSGVPTGMVTFLDGSTILSTPSLDPNGSASLALSNLSLGTHTISAQYAGDSANASATASLQQVIRQGATTVSIGSSNASAPVGTTVTLQGSVASLDGLVPTGQVVFRSGNVTLGNASVQADGSFVLPLANLTAGSYSIIGTYGGDTDDAGSSSMPLAQAVNHLPTQTVLSANTPSLSAGATLQLSARTTIAAGATAFGTLSGIVTFTDNGVLLGTAAVAADGSATFSAVGLTVGTHAIVAAYGGNANYALSSGSLQQVVAQTATTIVLTPASPSVLAGKSASFVAAVSSSTGTPTGSVVFQDGAVTVGTVKLLNGVAVFTTSGLTAGSHTLTGTYTGDANYLPMTSTPVNLQVVLAATSVALTGPGSAVTVTTAANFAAALSSPGVTPTGMLTLLDGTTVIQSRQVSGTAAISFAVSTLAVGQHTLTVQYSGDANNAVSTSLPVTVQVVKADTAVALVTSGSPAVLGKNVTLTATVTSAIANLTGTVDLLEGSQVVGSGPVANGVAAIVLNTLPFGNQTLMARYSGDAQHASSLSSALQQSILEPATVALTSSLNPAISGQAVTISAAVPAVAGMVPTGTVVFSDGATILATVALNAAGQANVQSASLTVGAHTIQAMYSGDANFTQAQSSLQQTVTLATTHMTAAIGSNPATFGAVTDLSATVVSDGSTATGSVQFTEAGAVLGTAVLDASGVAVLHTATLTPGSHSVVVTYAGDGRAGAATAAPLVFLVKQLTTLTLTSAANPALTLDHVVLTATLQSAKAVAATGSITFLDGTQVVGTAALDANGIATLNLPPLPAATHNMTATYAGDTADFPASAAVFSQAVQVRATRTSLSSSSTSLTDTQQVTFIVIVQSPTPSSVAAPSGSVTLYNGTTAIGTVPLDGNGTATFTTRLQPKQSGTFSATYAGDASYAPSASDTSTVDAGLAAQFNLTLSSTAVSVARAQHTVVTVTAASVQGFSDNLKMGCVGLPYAATCTFTSNGNVNTGMALAANGSGTMQLTIDTGNPLGSGSQTTSSLLGSRAAVLCLLPACLLFFRGMRRRRVWPLLLLYFVSLVSVGVTGCGGLQINSTPTGTYTFQVTAVGQSSGVTESQTVTLTVGQ